MKWIMNLDRSSHPEVFCKKGVHKNFAKFTGKYLRQSPYFNKIAGLRPATSLKKRLWHRCFPVNFAKCFRTTFYRTPLVVASIYKYIWDLILNNGHVIWDSHLKKHINTLKNVKRRVSKLVDGYKNLNKRQIQCCKAQ